MKIGQKIIFTIIITAFLIVHISINPARADRPSLLGIWEGQYKTYVYQEDDIHIGQAKMALNISEQNEEFLSATHSWNLHEDNKAKPDIAGEVVRGGTEQLIGIFRFDERNLVFMEIHDNGVFDVTIVDADTLHAVYREHDHQKASLFRVVLKRVGK